MRIGRVGNSCALVSPKYATEPTDKIRIRQRNIAHFSVGEKNQIRDYIGNATAVLSIVADYDRRRVIG
jgi:hypothetical protein